MFPETDPPKKNNLHVDLCRGGEFESYVQCFAAWIPDTLRGDAAYRRFLKIADSLKQECEKNKGDIFHCVSSENLAEAHRQGGMCAVLTVENGAALGGRIEAVEEMKRRGVRMLTLTWNGENELGRGVMAPGNTGLTPFGKRAVKALERAGIVVDLSHASPELFEDTLKIAEKPVVASHSNAKAVCPHPRNLTDRQFLDIKAAGGLVGLNFYRAFLSDKPDNASMEDILRHAEHFLSLGGEDVLAMGSDFDGSELPKDMEGLQSLPVLWELFLRHNYSEMLIKKIFYENAQNFFIRNNVL